MSDCDYCRVEMDCHYPHKPCDCVHQEKFWDAERRLTYDAKQELPESIRGMLGVLKRGRSRQSTTTVFGAENRKTPFGSRNR